MNKVTRSILGLGGIIATAWWLGGMMYFIIVAKHFRDEENRENVSKNISSYIGGVNARIDTPNKTSQIKPPRVIRDSDPLQALSTYPNKWRSYYTPTNFGRNPSGLRPGETGWDN